MKTYGLIGKNIDYSFSRTYFAEKFKREKIDAIYQNFDLPDITGFPDIFAGTPDLAGLNVTIPYKQSVMAFLDNLHPDAEKIGAVNTIKIEANNQLTGYNTDFIGFAESLKPFLKPHHKKALILGTGGASKAVAYTFENLDIDYRFVSRKSGNGILGYSEITENLLEEFHIIVNCTPLGTYPTTENHPNIPFQYLSEKHLVYDLIYNPETTKLMVLAKAQGATITNGLRMLELQAEAAWKLWNE